MSTEAKKERSLEPWLVGFLMTIVVFVVPWYVGVSQWATVVCSIGWTWGMNIEGVVDFRLAGPDIWFNPVVYVNYIYVLSMVRLYQSKTTYRRAMLWGLLTSFPILFIEFMTLLPALWDPMWPYRTPEIFPFPFSALIGFLLTKAFPPPEKPLSWTEDEDQSWWDRSYSTLREPPSE